jgi:predicted MFS family arabinose efflux permease
VATLLLIPVLPVLLAAQRAGEELGDERGADAHVSADRPPPRGLSAPIGVILLLSTVGFLRVAGEGVPGAFFTLYLDTELLLPTAEIGALIGTARLLAIPAAMLAPLAMARWGKERTVVIGALGVTLGLIPMGLIPHWAAAGFGLMAMTALASISRSAFIVYSQEAVPARWRVAISAATTMAASLSRTMTSFGGGLAIQHIGYGNVFLAGGALTAAGAALFWIRFCLPLRKKQASGV